MALPRGLSIAGLLCAVALGTAAQELSPRAFWPAPVGTQVLVSGYSYSTGDVLTDPSLPVYGVDSRINTSFLAYLQTFDLWGRTSNLVVELPYSWGTTQGILENTAARRNFSGFSDLGLSLAVNLKGAPAMTGAEFLELRRDPSPILGGSLKIIAPTGTYHDDRLVNTGANRWAAKLELGYIYPVLPKWLIEAELGAWVFGDDSDYVGGRREQNPIYALEVHVVRRFSPGFWASLDANYYRGGQQTINGRENVDFQRNARIGGTLVKPFGGRHAVKIGYSGGVTTTSGTDFDQFLLSWTMRLN